jgi:hypothetical protein
MSKEEADEAARKKVEVAKKVLIASAIGVGVVGAAYAYKRYGAYYVDDVIKAGTTIQNLSSNPDRMKAGEAFYAAHKKIDMKTYIGAFGKDALGENKFRNTATAAKDKTITIALDEAAPNMIMIESNQTGGDGGFTKYAIEKATPTINVVLGANGYSTFRPGLNVKLASGATVYTAKIQDGAVVLSEVAADAVIGYDEGVILKGTEGATAVFTVVEDEATELDNDLIGANALTNFDDYTYPYVLASNGTKTSFVKLTSNYYDEMFGKAFIVYSGSQQSLEVKFDGATAVEAIAEANENASEAPVKVIKDGKLFIGNYNVAGQLVK